MLTCITSSKQSIEEEGTREEEAHGTQSSKEGVKSLTIQIKDMAIKMSRAYRQCKPCSGSSNYKKGERPFPDLDAISEGTPYPYLQQGNSSSMHGVCGSRLPGGLASIIAPSNEVLTLAKEEEEEDQKEWVAQVEPGVQITFMSLPHGCGNNLKRVRFSREMFDKGQAQRWWGENYDRIMELYNVQQFNRQALQTPARSGGERDSSYSRLGSAKESAMTPSLNTESKPTKNNYEYSDRRGFFLPETSSSDQGRSQHYSTDVPKGERASVDVSSRTTISSRDDISVANSNMSEIELEWVEQDEPGVYITIRQLADGTRELRRVRFSRERYGEMHAKIWWEQNRERIQSQYL